MAKNKKHGKLDVQCMECGCHFTARSVEPRCPKCRSYDIDIVEHGDGR